MATTTAKARGSDTAQNLSVANMITRSTQGLVDPQSSLGNTLGGFGGLLGLIYKAPEAATRELLTEAMVNPRFARDLLSRASPASMQRALGYMETNMLERLQQAAINTAGRQAIRSTAGEAGRQQE